MISHPLFDRAPAPAEGEAADLETVLRKGYLPPDVDETTTDVEVYINRFPRGDIDRFSVARAAVAHARHKAGMPGGWAWASWEKQYLDALAEVEYKAQGQGDRGPGMTGAFLAPEAWSSSWFTLLRSNSFIDNLPITRVTVPMRVVHIPKVTGDIAVSFAQENTAIPSSQYTFGDLSYTARESSALILVSNEDVRDGAPLVDQVLRTESAKAIAQNRDIKAMSGIGGINPTGIVNNPAVASYDMSAGGPDASNQTTPDYADLINLKYQVQHLNGTDVVPPGQSVCDGVVANVLAEKVIQSMTDSAERPLWMGSLNAAGGFLGIPNWVFVSDLVLPGVDNATSIVAGSWSSAVLFECAAVQFDATVEATGFAYDQTLVRIKYRFDFGLAHPEAFATLNGTLSAGTPDAA